MIGGEALYLVLVIVAVSTFAVMLAWRARESGRDPMALVGSRKTAVALKLLARRNKLLGLWAAAHMGLCGEDAAGYALSIIAPENAESSDAAIIKKICGDLVGRGFPIVEDDVHRQLLLFAARARAELSHGGSRRARREASA
jgi:hypothetical protein